MELCRVKRTFRAEGEIFLGIGCMLCTISLDKKVDIESGHKHLKNETKILHITNVTLRYAGKKRGH